MEESEIPGLLSSFGMAGARWIVTHVAGVCYHEWEDLRVARRLDLAPGEGARLSLVRKPWNRHDPNAVEIRSADGKLMLGFIKRQKAASIAPVLDDGGRIEAFLLDVAPHAYEPLTVVLAGDVPADLWRRFHEWRESELLEQVRRAEWETDPARARVRRLWDAFLDGERARLSRRRQAMEAFAPEHPDGTGADGRPHWHLVLSSEEWRSRGWIVSKAKPRPKPVDHLRDKKRMVDVPLWGAHQVVPMDRAEFVKRYMSSPDCIRDANAGLAPWVTLTMAGRERTPGEADREATTRMFAERHGLQVDRVTDLLWGPR
jgi:hypothetical protein